MLLKLKTNRQRNHRGQGIVEFALAFPIFLLIVLGIFEFGRLFVMYTSLYAAAREGARYGSAVENLGTNCVSGVTSQAQRIAILSGTISVNVQYDAGPGSTLGSGCGSVLGQRTVVTASTPFKSVTGIIPSFNLQSVARRTIFKEVRLRNTLLPPGAATPIPQATNTPGPAPTETPFGTPPPTATPTTAGICNGTMTWTAGTGDSSFATFTNNNGTQYVLTSFVVTWSNPDPTLNEVLYIGSGYEPLTSLLLKSPATVTIPNGGWTIGAGTSNFEFIFSATNAQFLGVHFVMTDPMTGLSCVVN